MAGDTQAVFTFNINETFFIIPFKDPEHPLRGVGGTYYDCECCINGSIDTDCLPTWHLMGRKVDCTNVSCSSECGLNSARGQKDPAVIVKASSINLIN